MALILQNYIRLHEMKSTGKSTYGANMYSSDSRILLVFAKRHFTKETKQKNTKAWQSFLSGSLIPNLVKTNEC